MQALITRFLARFLGDDRGTTAIEYGLIISLIFLVIITAVTAFSNQGANIFNTAMNAIRTGMN